MFIIEYTTPAPVIANSLDLGLNLGLSVTTIDRSVNGLIRITGTSVLALGGQLDIADLANRPGQAMLIEAFSIASDNPLGVTSLSSVMGPLEPGNTDNAARAVGGIIIPTADAPVILDIPILIPPQHRWGMSVVDGPLRVILQCREFLAGDLENDWIQGQLVA